MIHPTAIVDSSADIGKGVSIGAYSIIGKNVTIGAGTRVFEHVIVRDGTQIGEQNTIYQFASLGEVPQDKKYQGEVSGIIIGHRNVIREACTIHKGTNGGNTVIGNDNLLMVNTHVAHDCVIGDHNIFANNVGLAGHVRVGNHVILGGATNVHQFCQIDDYSMSAGATLILKDVAAFVMVQGNPARVRGLNKEGMRRRGWSANTISAIEEAYDIVFMRHLVLNEVLDALAPVVKKEPLIALLVDSIQKSERGLTRQNAR